LFEEATPTFSGDRNERNEKRQRTDFKEQLRIAEWKGKEKEHR
jgi:hypothetical protein